MNRPIFNEIIASNDRRIPVKIILKRMTGSSSQEARIMLIISNESWKTRNKREKEKLKAQAIFSELKALKAQVNPHFLFNTLNTIAYFAEFGPKEAVEIAEKLSELFRYSLDSTKRDFVKIHEEVDNIRKYIDIESARFGRRLQTKIILENEVEEEQMPPMLILPIIENAIKYGEGRDGKIEVALNVRRSRRNVNIVISDRGKKRTKIASILSGDGAGLKNINQRLKTLYRRSLRFRRTENGGLTVLMDIPVREKL